MEEKEALVQITSEGIKVINEKLANDLEKKKISASMITGLKSCPARWLMNSFVVPEIIIQEPDNAARRGSMFHQVMENFFSLPQGERTEQAMRDTVKEVLLSDKYKDFAGNKDAVAWLRSAVNGYYNMSADTDPKDVVIAELETAKGSSKGLEVFVIGKIGDTKRQTLGFIDRCQELVKDKGTGYSKEVVVEDWKTGKVKRYNPKSRAKNPEGIDEQRQQIIYSILLESEYGVKVSAARLIYPISKEVVDVDLSDTKLRERVIKDVEETDKQLDNHIERNLFEYSPSFCSWCPVAKICPATKRFLNSEKAEKAYESQPEPEVFKSVVKF